MDLERQWGRKMKLRGNAGCCYTGIVARTTAAVLLWRYRGREAFWRCQGLHFHRVIQIGPPKVIWYKFLQKTCPTVNADGVAQGFDASGQENFQGKYSVSFGSLVRCLTMLPVKMILYVIAFLNVMTKEGKNKSSDF